MGGRNWHQLQNIDRGRLREARLQAHYAAQWLGRVGSALIPPQPDYSHTSMSWNDALAGLVTESLKDEARLGLKIADLTLVLLDKGEAPVSSFPLEKRSDQDLRQWLDRALGAAGMDARLLDKTTPYEIPAHAIAKGAPYSAAGLSDALRELAAWFANADSALGEIRLQMARRSLSASPVRCWPHHFDLATLISLDKTSGEHGRSVNAGLSPGDEHYDEPYFYVSPYPYPDPAKLPPLPKLGHWHTRDFTAAIAPASKIIASKDQGAETNAFLNAAVEGAIKAIG